MSATAAPNLPAGALPGAWSGRLRRFGGPLLAAAFIVSISLHALLLLIHFRLPEAKPARDKGLEVVLVNARHAQAPEKAEVLAQANIDAGGNTEQEVRASTPLPPQPNRQDGDALVEAKRRTPEPQREISGLDLLDSAAAVARIEAQIDRDLKELAKRPRKKFFGARAQEYRFAQYVEDWRQKVERIGTLNYPAAARGRLYGSLLLSVTIRSDGTVERVGVHRSSGHKVLDDAALRIVKMAAPYAPIPPDIRKDYDIIEITRTWKFERSDRVRAY